MQKTLLALLTLIVCATACKKDDDEPCPPTTQPISYDTREFAPYTVGSWWKYTGVNIDPVTLIETPNSYNDSVRVVQDSVIDGHTYSRLVGVRFGVFGIDMLVRVDGAQLIDQNGTVLMDVTAVSDTLGVTPVGSPSPIDSIATVMQSQTLTLNTPVGPLLSEHARDLVFYMAPGFQSPLHERDHYVRDIGVGVYTTYYAGSGIRVEMRLAEYHIEP